MNTDDADDKTRVAPRPAAAPPPEETRVCPRCQTANPVEQLPWRDYRCGSCKLEMAHLDVDAEGEIRGVLGWLHVAGERIVGRYQVDSILGKGGFGATYLVKDKSLFDKPLVLKEVPERLFNEEEVKLLLGLKHRGIPVIYGYQIVDGMAYIVQEFGGRNNLGDERKRTADKRIPQAVLLPWMRQLCEVLMYLHSQKPPIIHRDLKPDNILINDDGDIMLIDFGIAKKAVSGAMTQLMGQAATPFFSPPEQLTGAGTDERSDIYALGATLYALLAGQNPQRIDGVLPPLSSKVAGIAPEVEQAIMQSLNLQRQDRQQTVREFAEALGVLDSSTGRTQARTTASVENTQILPPLQPPVAAKPSNPLLLPGLAGLALLAAAVAYYLIAVPSDTPVTPAPQTQTPAPPPVVAQTEPAPVAPAPVEPAAPIPPAPPATPVAPPQPPAAPVSAEAELIGLIPKLNSFPLQLSQAFYRDGNLIEFSLDLPAEGFLHVFIVEPSGKSTLIFPSKFMPNNQVKPGVLKLPNGKPPLVASPPYGKLWVVAVFENTERNIYRQNNKGNKTIFVEWTSRQMLDFLQQSMNDGSSKASGVETQVCAKTGPCE